MVSEKLVFELSSDEDWREVLLTIHSKYVLENTDGKKIFKPGRFEELETFVRKGLHSFPHYRSEVFWALLIGLAGVFGLIAAYVPEILRLKSRARIKRWIDEEGHTIYLASVKELMIPLLKLSRDRRIIIVEPALVSALKYSGHYLVKLSYPAGYASWEEAIGLEADPKLEVVMNPEQLGERDSP